MTSWNAFEHDGFNGFRSIGYNARNGGGKLFIYVCGESSGGASVWKLDADLNVIWSYNVGVDCYRLDVDAAGSVYIAHEKTSNKSITKLDSSGALVWNYGTPSIVRPYGVAAHTDGTVRFTANGNCISLDSSGGLDWSTASTVNGAGGVDCDDDGNAYVGENNLTSLGARSLICKISPAGSVLGTTPNNSPLPLQLGTGGSILHYNDIVYFAGSSSSDGSFPQTVLGNIRFNRNLTVNSSQFGNTRGSLEYMFVAFAGGNYVYNNRQSIPLAGFNVSGTTSTPAAGIGGDASSLYAAARFLNDGHTGATATVNRNVFKFDYAGNLQTAIALGGDLYHLIASPYG